MWRDVLGWPSAGYAPAGKRIGDAWFAEVNGKLYMFHLQMAGADGHKVSIGHAVLGEDGKWETLPTALLPGGPGDHDEHSLWTGSFFEYDGKYWLLYTVPRAGDLYQTVGAAWSEDMVTWTKLPEPIIEADGEVYAGNVPENSLGVISAFRDPFVCTDPATGETYVVITARKGGEQTPYNGCLALYKMGPGGMTDWQLCSPLLSFDEPRYDEMEVPQVVFYNGRVYVFFTVHDWLIADEWAAKVGRTSGLRCYVGDSLAGPFVPANGKGGLWDDLEGVRGLRVIGDPDENGQCPAMGWVQKYDGFDVGETTPLFCVTFHQDGGVTVEMQ